MSAVDQKTKDNLARAMRKLSEGNCRGFGAVLIGFDDNDGATVLVLANGRLNPERTAAAFGRGTLELLMRTTEKDAEGGHDGTA